MPTGMFGLEQIVHFDNFLISLSHQPQNGRSSGRQPCARQLRGLSQGYSQSINNARNGGVGYWMWSSGKMSAAYAKGMRRKTSAVYGGLH